MRNKSRFKRTMSIFLTALMVITSAIPTFAASSMQTTTTNLGSGTALSGSTWSNNSQFMRISMYWAPYATSGTPGVGTVDNDGIDWANYVKVGDTFDWALNNGKNPEYRVAQHSRFTSAKDYYDNSYEGKMGMSAQKGTYEGWGKAWHFDEGTLKRDDGSTLKFPRRVGTGNGSNNIDIKDFFNQRATLNEVIVMAREGKDAETTAQRQQGYGVGALNVDKLKAGAYTNFWGEVQYGKYLITVEPGAYMPINGVYSAVTLRDAIAWGRGSTMMSWAPLVAAYIANSLHLEGNGLHEPIGLTYKSPKTYTDSMVKNSANFSHLKSTMGVGTVWFLGTQGQLPTINYYYNLTPDETIFNDEGEPIGFYTSAFERPADASLRVEVAGNSYTAPKYSAPDGQGETHRLVQGYIGNTEDLNGSLDKDEDEVLPHFEDTVGVEQVTQEAKDYVGYEFDQPEIGKWDTATDMVSSIPAVAAVSGLQTKPEQIHVTPEYEIEVNYGTGTGKLQANFVYVTYPNLVSPASDEVPSLVVHPEEDWIDPPDPLVTPKPGTFVTKMYYDTPEDPTPSKITVEPIPNDQDYPIPDSDGDYDMTDWGTVPDDTPGQPEPYNKWEEVEPDVIEGGSDPDTVTPEDLVDPDTEIVIKFVMPEEDPSERIGGDLILTEKRISWSKDLSDIGGPQEVEFDWKALTHTHSHKVGSGKKKKTKTYNESVKDGSLTLVATNLNAVKDDIMGNTQAFKPYDYANVKSQSTGKNGGPTTMTPNYHYVIWRGKDIPTIASYKYGDTTGSGNAPNAPIVEELVGRTGIQPAGSRNANNNSYYMDGFTVKEGKANEDTQGNKADYAHSGKCSKCGATWNYTASGDSVTFTPTVRVDVGYGYANVGNAPVTFKSENLNAGGIDFTNVTGYAINNTEPIEFYPYVEQWFDSTSGAKEEVVYTLGGHKSTFVPRDYIEIGYWVKAANVETTTGLVLQSQQWSTHQAALKLSGGKKNVVLPGGAIYRLITPATGANGNTRSKVAMSSWMTFLPQDTINATVKGKELYSGAVQNAKNEMLYKQVLNGLNSLDIVQIVDGTMVDQIQAGTQRVPGTSGQPTSTDAKYWLRQNLKDGSGTNNVPASVAEAMKINSTKPSEADLDIISQNETRVYYRVYSDVQGNVYVSKGNSADATKPGSGTILGKISKTQTAADLLAQNNEIKALNNRTKLVENFIDAIDRNEGNDVSISDSKWYNEAWDGICVVRVNKVMEIGFKDNNADGAVRTAAMDPKLQTKRTSQSDMYKTGITSWFEADKHTNLSNVEGYLGTYDASNTGGGKIDIVLKNMNGLYRSKNFKLTNVSVMDLY